MPLIRGGEIAFGAAATAPTAGAAGDNVSEAASSAGFPSGTEPPPFEDPPSPEGGDAGAGAASTVHAKVAGVGSTLPARSIASTWKPCGPAASPG